MYYVSIHSPSQVLSEWTSDLIVGPYIYCIMCLYTLRAKYFLSEPVKKVVQVLLLIMAINWPDMALQLRHMFALQTHSTYLHTVNLKVLTSPLDGGEYNNLLLINTQYQVVGMATQF